MRASRPVFAAYAILAGLNLVAAGASHPALEWATKPFLMPLLALWFWLACRERGQHPAGGIIAALIFSAAGDIALLNEGSAWFIAGMVLFLGAHISYLGTFLRHGAATRLSGLPMLLIPAGYAVTYAAALAWLWPALSGVGLALPMTGYGLALAGTASLSAAFGWRTGLGGGLFLLSDLLIAIGVADAVRIPGPPIWVMLTYLAAQTLLVTGWLTSRMSANT